MFIKLIIITAILVGFLVLVLGIRQWLDPQSQMAFHSCSEKPGKGGSSKYCIGCNIREITDCNKDP